MKKLGIAKFFALSIVFCTVSLQGYLTDGYTFKAYNATNGPIKVKIVLYGASGGSDYIDNNNRSGLSESAGQILYPADRGQKTMKCCDCLGGSKDSGVDSGVRIYIAEDGFQKQYYATIKGVTNFCAGHTFYIKGNAVDGFVADGTGD